MSAARPPLARPFLVAPRCAVVLLLALAGELAGQSTAATAPTPPAKSTEAKTSWSEQIVVTASRDEQTAGEVPLHLIVIDPRELGAATDFGLSDLVSRQVPSLNLQVAASSLAASPREQSLNFRGVSGGSVSHALLLVDGLPMLDPYNATAIWSKVPKALIERVEVVPGGGATVWGNLALSGVVNLITRPPSDRALELEARLAEHATTGATARYSDQAGEWAGWGALDHFATDGYVTADAASRGPADEPDFRNYDSLTAYASRELSPSALLHLRALGYRENRGEGTRLDRAENREGMASVSADLVIDARHSWQLRSFGRRQSLDDFTGSRDEAHATVLPSAHIYDLTSDNVGASAVWSRVAGERHTLTAGTDLQLVTIDRHESLDFDGAAFTQRYEVGGKQQLAGGFVESRWRIDPRWSAQLSARADAIRTSGGRSRRTSLSDDVVTEDESFAAHTETTLDPSAGFVFQATSAGRLRGSVYSGFRAAAPSELFVGAAPRNNRVTAPNPELAPEKLIGGEVGFDYSPSRRFDARATGFWSETKDLIDRITLGRVGSAGGFLEPCGAIGPNGSCTQRRNLGTTRAYGLELDGGYRPHPRWRLQLDAALIKTEIVENPAVPALVGHEIEHTPKERLTLAITYEDPRGFAVAVRGRRSGDSWADAENQNLLPAYTVCDLTLSRAFSQRLDVFAGIENLFDEEYRVDFGSAGFLVGARRIFQLGIRLRAGTGT